MLLLSRIFIDSVLYQVVAKYVEIDGKNVKLNIEDKDFNQDYVYLKKTDVGYKVSKVPFAIEIVEEKPTESKKKTVTRKKKISSEKTN